MSSCAFPALAGGLCCCEPRVGLRLPRLLPWTHERHATNLNPDFRNVLKITHQYSVAADLTPE